MRRHQALKNVALVVLAVIVIVVIGLATRSKHAPTVSSPQPTFTPTATKSAKPSSLWIGDSYTAGTGATDQAHAESCLTATAMAWTCDLDAEGGTGYIANGHTNSPTFQPLMKRLAADKANYVGESVIVVDAGRNDPSTSATTNAARKYLTALRSDFPRARLVLIDPYFMTSTAAPNPALDALYKARAATLHAVVIDPLAEGWINAASAKLTISDHVHPDPSGHQYLARHLAAEFKRLGLRRVQ